MKKTGFSERHKNRVEKEAIKAEILSEIKGEKKISKTENVSHNLQILILHYLSIGKQLNNVKRAKLFASIINRNKEVTRQKLSSIETFNTEENLEFLLEFFEAIGFEEQISTVKKELVKKKPK